VITAWVEEQAVALRLAPVEAEHEVVQLKVELPDRDAAVALSA
jgi:hypothetical protein